MTETEFINKNNDDWKRLDELLKSDEKNAEETHKLFMKVSSDLSYAQTYYPKRNIRWQLNALMGNIFDTMRSKKKWNLLQIFSRFYTQTLAREIIKNKYSFIISFCLFTVALLIGIYSTLKDPQFPEVILGKEYVSMTEANIKKGDPMAVYKSGTNLESFTYITINNVRVAFMTYVCGLLAGIGSVFVMIYNGIMVGCFQTFFYNKNLLLESMLSIWIHGTIEIISIIIAGAAGLILSKHLLFPNTYTRMQSLKKGGVSSLIVILSVTPLIILAGCFEGYVTPQTQLPNWIKFAIILSSLIFMIAIYIVNPILYARKNTIEEDPIIVESLDNEESNSDQKYPKKAISFIGKHFENILFYYFVPLATCGIIYYYYYLSTISDTGFITVNKNIIDQHNGGLSFKIFKIISYAFCILFVKTNLTYKKDMSYKNLWLMAKKHLGSFALASTLVYLPFYYFENQQISYSLLLLIPISIISIFIYSVNDKDPDIVTLLQSIKKGYVHWFNLIGAVVISILVSYLILSVYKILTLFIVSYLSWHTLFENYEIQNIFINNIFLYFSEITIDIISLHICYFAYQDLLEKKYSIDIKEKVNSFTSIPKIG
jgi:uncharacterized membrane protein SpoIIM required for sporulation/general stress protein CsbA